MSVSSFICSTCSVGALSKLLGCMKILDWMSSILPPLIATYPKNNKTRVTAMMANVFISQGEQDLFQVINRDNLSVYRLRINSRNSRVSYLAIPIRFAAISPEGEITNVAGMLLEANSFGVRPLS